MLPYSESFLETYVDSVNYDSIAFKISYDIDDGTDDKFYDQIFQINSVKIGDGIFPAWTGEVKNNTGYRASYVKIVGLFFEDGDFINTDLAYIDVPDSVNHIFEANETCSFDNYLLGSSDFDSARYFIDYALYSLYGEGNIPANKPSPTSYFQLANTGEEIHVSCYLLDKNEDDVKFHVIFGDNNSLSSGFVPSGQVTSVSHIYSEPGVYYLKFKSCDNQSVSGNTEEPYFIWVTGNTSVNEKDVINNDNEIVSFNYPNPFHDKTNIYFENKISQNVEIKLYDLSGILVKKIMNEYRTAGQHKIVLDAGNLSSGIYFYRIKMESSIVSKKMICLH